MPERTVLGEPGGFAGRQNRSGLLVVDMQRAFCAPEGPLAALGLPVGRFGAIVPAVATLVLAARDGGVPVFFTRLVFRADGADVGRNVAELQQPLLESRALAVGSTTAALIDELAPLDTELVVDKQHADAFHGTNLDGLLRAHRVNELVVAGVTTGVCVSSSARAAAELGFRTSIVADATAERDDALHAASLDLFSQAFGYVETVDDVLERWPPRRDATASVPFGLGLPA